MPISRKQKGLFLGTNSNKLAIPNCHLVELSFSGPLMETRFGPCQRWGPWHLVARGTTVDTDTHVTPVEQKIECEDETLILLNLAKLCVCL